MASKKFSVWFYRTFLCKFTMFFTKCSKKFWRFFCRVNFCRKKKFKEIKTVWKWCQTHLFPNTQKFIKNRKNGKNEFCVFQSLAPLSHRFYFFKLFSPKMNSTWSFFFELFFRKILTWLYFYQTSVNKYKKNIFIIAKILTKNTKISAKKKKIWTKKTKFQKKNPKIATKKLKNVFYKCHLRLWNNPFALGEIILFSTIFSFFVYFAN